MDRENRYHRQILLPEIGEDGQNLLHQARVLLVGVGGLGSPIALNLVGAGIGTLGLMDDDVVSLTNLHRQVLYGESQLGISKAQKAAERLGDLNSEVLLEVYPYRLNAENAAEIISRYDIVVDGCDNFATRFLIDDACAALVKPYVYGAVCGFEGQVAVFNTDLGASRYRDLYPDEEETLKMPHPGKQVLGTTTGLIGSVMAEQVFQLICGYGETLKNQLWTIDLRTLQTFKISLLPET